MTVASKLAIKINSLIEEEFINSDFDYDKAENNAKYEYSLLFAAQYKLSTMAMDIGSLHDSFNLKTNIDQLIFGKELKNVFLSIEHLTREEIPKLLRFIARKYAIYAEKMPELSQETPRETFEIATIVFYTASNLIFIVKLGDNYAMLASLEGTYMSNE